MTAVSGLLLTLAGAATLRAAAVVSPGLRMRHGTPWLFASFLAGILTTVVCTSLIATGGNTINVVLLGAVCAGVALASSDRGGAGGLSRAGSPPWLWFTGVGAAVGVWFTMQHAREGGFPWQVPFRDIAHYGQVAAAVLQTGVETPIGAESMVAPDLFRPAPYHYFEIWFAAALATIWGVPKLLAVMVMAPTLLALALGAGLLALAEQTGTARPPRLWAAIALWLGPFLPSVALKAHLLREADVFTGFGSILGHPKLLPLYLCLAAALLLAESGRPAAALLAASCCGVVNFTAMPVTLAAAVLGLARALKEGTRTVRIAFVTPSLILVGVLLFYGCQATGSGPFPQANELLRTAGDPTMARTRLNIFGKTLIQLGIVYAPLLLVVGLRTLLLQLRRYGLVLASVLALGLVTWAMLEPWPNSVQFLANAAVVLLNVLVIVAYLHAGTARRLVAVAAVGLLTARQVPDIVTRFAGPPRQGDTYLRNLDRIPGRVGGFTVSRSYLEKASPHERNLRVNAPEYLGFNDRSAVPLNCPIYEVGGIEPAFRMLTESTLACQYLGAHPEAALAPPTMSGIETKLTLSFIVARGQDAPLPAGGRTLTLVSRDPSSGDAIYSVGR